MNNAQNPDLSTVPDSHAAHALVASDNVAKNGGEQTSVWMFMIAGVLTLSVVFAFWFAWSTISKPQPSEAVRPLDTSSMVLPSVPAGINDPDQVNVMIQRLTERLKNSPSDVAGWAMLARTHGVVGHTNEAVQAYAKATALSPNDAGLLVDYADALAVKNNHSLAGEPFRLVERALKMDPRNVKALALAGSFAFDNQDYAVAVKYWDKVVEIAGTDNLFAQRTRFQLEQARQLISSGAGARSASSATSAASNDLNSKNEANIGAVSGSISGLVTLLPSLSGEVKPDDAVFVFARGAQGSRMPLAILRKQVKDLPIRYTLNFSMTNTTSAPGSAAGGIQVVARISKSGNAVAVKGDYSGTSEVVKINAKDVNLQINQVVNL